METQNMNKFLFALGALAISTSCIKATTDCDSADTAACDTGSDTGDTAEGCAEFTGTFGIGIDTTACAVPENAPEWDVNWDCDPGTNDYWYEIYTIGWAKNVELYIDQDTASPWTEYHNSDDLIGNGDSYESYDEDGYWDYYYLYLQNSTDFAEVQDDPTKTLYVCGDGRIATLSWFFVANADADAAVDCIAWGAEPDIFDTTGCSAPSWI